MKHTVLALVLAVVAAAPLTAGGKGNISGAYVEARTAEVFTGGCIMNSEAETMGRQAVLAWKVDRGSFNGVSLDGLTVVAALSADRNLGMVEMGGVRPAVRSAMFVDNRANAVQQIALVAMVSDSAVARGISAAEVVRDAAKLVGGGGGGRPNVAQAGGRDATRLDEALALARAAITERLGAEAG